MPYSRLIPTAVVGLLLPLVAWAQDPAPATPGEPPTLAENVLTKTVIELRLRPRIAAEIAQDVDMLNQRFVLEGQYYKDTEHRVRLQLNLLNPQDAGGTGSTMLQVCDGKILWDYKKVLGMESYNRRDITQILKRIQDPALDEQFRGLITTNLGFGGPEAMLAGLQKAIKFDQFSEEKAQGVDSFILGGTWRDRTGLMGPNDRPLSPTAPLPPYIPSNVRVFIEKATFWPYRIEMIGNTPSMLAEETREFDQASGRPISVKKAPPRVDPSRITLRYKLLPETAIEPKKHFVFAAPANAANLKDDTEEYLANLDTYIQNEAARKKAEAAKGEGEPLFKAPPLEAPSPGTDAAAPTPAPR